MKPPRAGGTRVIADASGGLFQSGESSCSPSGVRPFARYSSPKASNERVLIAT